MHHINNEGRQKNDESSNYNDFLTLFTWLINAVVGPHSIGPDICVKKKKNKKDGRNHRERVSSILAGTNGVIK